MPPPDELKVFVFTAEELAQDQDELVVLVLPPEKKGVGQLGPFDLEHVWIATWNHWSPAFWLANI